MNENIDFDESLYPNVRRRNLSPDNKEKITQRIIQYFEDPKESKALAMIKNLSNNAKRKSSKENTGHFLRRGKQFSTQTYVPKNYKMTLIDEIKIKLNEYNNNKNEKNKKKENDYNNINNQNKNEIHTLQNNILTDKEDVQKKDDIPEERDNINDNKNKNKIDETNNIYNNNYNSRNYPSNRRFKKTNIESRFKKNRFIDNNNCNSYVKNALNFRNRINNKRKSYNKSYNTVRNSLNNSINDINDRKKINDLRLSYSNITDEYRRKNNITIENIHNKEKIIINEYKSKNKNNPNLKRYNSEYIWDRNINRLVEKRTYLDDEDDTVNNIEQNKEKKPEENIIEENKPEQKKVNESEDRPEENKIEENNIEEKEPKENIFEEKKPENKVNIKITFNRKSNTENDRNNNRYIDIDYDVNINVKEEKDSVNNYSDERKENDNEKREIRKRFDKIQKIKKEDEIENQNQDLNDKKNETPENKNKEINRSYGFLPRYRFNNVIKEEEKLKKKEIIIEKTIINKEEKYKKPIIEKVKTINKSTYQYYRRKQRFTSKEKEGEKEKEKEKEKEENNNNEPNEPKYKKKDKIPPLEFNPKPIYTKKTKIEDRKIQKEIIPDKKYNKFKGEEKEKEEGKEIIKEKEKEKEKEPKLNPYMKYKNKKKNLRLNMLSNENNDEKDNKDNDKINNNTYSQYIKDPKKRNDRKMHRTARTESKLIDDLERIETYNVSTYLKNDLLQIYDNINDEFNDFKNNVFYSNINSFEINMGDFDRKKIPFLKKKEIIDDLCKGRMTTDDYYKKYSKNAKKSGVRSERYYK